MMTSDTERETERLDRLASNIATLGPIDEASYEAGGISYHQAMHTAWICSEIVGTHLMENVAVLRDPEFYRLANQASDALGELYQKFGQKHGS